MQFVKESEEPPYNKVISSKLCSGGSFSIDGLICDLFLKAHNLDWQSCSDLEPNDPNYSKSNTKQLCLGHSHAMPYEVKQWAGMEKSNPVISFKYNGTQIDPKTDKPFQLHAELPISCITHDHCSEGLFEALEKQL